MNEFLITKQEIFTLPKEEEEPQNSIQCDHVCPVCNISTILINVHGHFQCSNCKTVTESCCDGGEI